ncbi:MAG: phenylalanine--tRNA ligase subunit alpha, partial [Oscillospiraceae bacterium]|nr:phenylalanine--tRNA ligase subunit alpha [Oscillospiraceae bacterium]
MKQQLEQIRQSTLDALAKVKDLNDLEEIRVRVLSKKGELTAILKQMGKLSAEERPVMGQLANNVRSDVEEMLEKKAQELRSAALEARLQEEALDVTIPGKPVEIGHKHPMNKALDEIKEIFIGMGFSVVEGPEIELAEYNFTRLNTEEGHPARDRSDTFYFTDDDSVLLRTQT